ncbi:MAG: YwiC-like family protein [Betaproteobacteria bacterium]|nr:YwiC-like family protein [Betaproteobacteria bacterium]
MNKHLIPREHGAYAELAFPLLSGLALGSPGYASWLFALAAILLFVANEPLVVLLGARGKRLQQELAVPARRQLAVLGALGAAAGLAALWLAPPVARWLALIPAVFAAGLAPVVLSKNLKTLPGEVIAGAAFSAMHLPVAAAGGVTGVPLWGPPVMWFVITVTATLAVHAIKSRVSGTMVWVVPAASWMGRVALLAALATWFWVPGWRTVALAACLPLAGVVVVNLLAPSPRKLKQVGWAVVAANALAVTLLAAG